MAETISCSRPSSPLRAHASCSGAPSEGRPGPRHSHTEREHAIHTFERPLHARGTWATWWRGWYRLLRIFERPLLRLALRRGFGNLVVLRVPGRRSGLERTLPLGLLRVGDHDYLGHPSGDTAWTLNLRAAGHAIIESAHVPTRRVRPVILGAGPERDAVVAASYRQHPFPGDALYRLAAAHVAATGVFFRLEPDEDPPGQPTAGTG